MFQISPLICQPTHNHGVSLFIPTKGPPANTCAWWLLPDKLHIAKQEFRKMEEMGIIRHSKRQWASLLHMVPKSSWDWRPGGDFCRLNAATIPDRSLVPHIQNFAANLADWPRLQLSLNPGPPRWHPLDSHHWPFRTCGNSFTCIWREKYCTDFPTTHGYRTSGPRLHLCLHRWHLGGQSLQVWAQSPSTTGVSMPTRTWPRTQFSQMPIWQARDQFPGTSQYETQHHSFCMFIICDPCFPPMFLRMQVNMPAYCSSCSCTCRCFREVLLLTSTFRPSSSLHQMFFAST